MVSATARKKGSAAQLLLRLLLFLLLLLLINPFTARVVEILVLFVLDEFSQHTRFSNNNNRTKYQLGK